MTSGVISIRLLACVCAVLGLAYVSTAVLVIASRVAFDRRRRFVADVEALMVRTADDAPDAGFRRAASAVAGARTGTLLRTADDPSASASLRRLTAETLVRRVGLTRLIGTALTNSRRHAWRRIAALQILSRASLDEAWPCLRQALLDGSDDVKAATVTLLGRLPDRRGAALLVDALVNGEYARSRIASSLEAFPLDIPDLITPFLASAHAPVRYWGALLSRRYATASLGPALRRAADDHDPLVRRAAIETLALIPGPDTERAVKPHLTDPVPFVRAHAARALAALADRDAIDDIAPLLADGDWWVRSAAKQALEAFGHSAADALRHYLTHADAFARDGAAELLQHLSVQETG